MVVTMSTKGTWAIAPAKRPGALFSTVPTSMPPAEPPQAKVDSGDP
jgi:hypothetical protein